MKLNRDFYLRDTLTVAKDLLGKYLVTNKGGYTVGKIVETEAYLGPSDKACHSHRASPSGRTDVMYEEGGKAYIFFIYGMYNCFNVVTGPQGHAEAVLVRSLEPVYGTDLMFLRRKRTSLFDLCSGPGKLCISCGIDKSDYGRDLSSSSLFIEDGEKIASAQIISTPRIGVDYAQEAKELPYRFVIRNSKFLSVK